MARQHKSQQSQMSEPLTESLRARTRRGMGRPDAAWQCGRRPISTISTIASEPVAETVPASELIAHLQGLPRRQRDVLQSVTLESISIKATATKFAMSECAVRVALHRGLTNLAAKLRKE